MSLLHTFKTKRIMKLIISTLFAILYLPILSAQNLTDKIKTVQPAVKVVKYETLKTVMQKKDNKLYVVNFWATWCAPCVKELPDFMEVNEKYSSRKDFKMLLVSLDDVKELKTKVIPFIKARNITTGVYLLDDNKRMNYWIPAIEKTWGGVIPATVFYKNGKKLHFIEGGTDKAELEKYILQNL
jgi:Thiol-disulfide isomerase and thioredoxins